MAKEVVRTLFKDLEGDHDGSSRNDLAKKVVKNVMEELEYGGGQDDEDYESVIGSEASTAYLSCGDESGTDVASLSDVMEESAGSDMIFACPGVVEETSSRPSALKGSSGRKAQPRVVH